MSRAAPGGPRKWDLRFSQAGNKEQEKKLVATAKEQKLSHTPLTTFNKSGKVNKFRPTGIISYHFVVSRSAGCILPENPSNMIKVFSNISVGSVIFTE